MGREGDIKVGVVVVGAGAAAVVGAGDGVVVGGGSGGIDMAARPSGVDLAAALGAEGVGAGCARGQRWRRTARGARGRGCGLHQRGAVGPGHRRRSGPGATAAAALRAAAVGGGRA